LRHLQHIYIIGNLLNDFLRGARLVVEDSPASSTDSKQCMLSTLLVVHGLLALVFW
jgi:hypothetical protein